MEAIDYDKLADAIAERITAANSVPLELQIWSAERCAEYLNHSDRTFKERISKHHSFPRAVRMPSEKGLGKCCYYAKDIIEGAKQL